MNAYETESIDVDRVERIVTARGKVAKDCAVWAHHFPEFPVLPGVLMLDLLTSAASKWYGSGLQIRNVRRVRFSNYLKPGAEWQGRIKLESSDINSDRWSGEIFSLGIKMASAVLTLSVKG